MAKEIELKLKEGDKAPAFTVATSGGGKISLADYKGQNVILYFTRAMTRRVARRKRVPSATSSRNSRRRARSFLASARTP